MSGTGQGFNGICGMARQTALATPIQATDLVPFNSESITEDPEFVDAEYLAGNAGIVDTDKVFEPVVGNIDIPILYNEKVSSTFKGSTLLIGAGMGQGGTWDAGSGDLQFLLDKTGFCADANRALLTIAIEKSVALWENHGCYVNSMTISGNAKEGLNVSADVIGYEQDRNTSSGVNTQANLASLRTTMAGVADKVMWTDLAFYIGDTANALIAGDGKNISAFSLTLNNNLTEPEQATIDPTTHTEIMKTLEPVQNGMREVTCELTIPRYTADTYLDWRSNGTRLQLEFHFVRTADSKEFHIYIPEAQITGVGAPVSGPGIVTQTISLKCLVPSHSITLFQDNSTVVSTEFGIDTDDERSAVLWS
jgi:hypothetical protein